jgi:hypothetical protein
MIKGLKTKLAIATGLFATVVVPCLTLTSCARASQYYMPVIVNTNLIKNGDIFNQDEPDLQKDLVNKDGIGNLGNLSGYDQSYQNNMKSYLPSQYIYQRTDTNGLFNSYAYCEPEKVSDMASDAKNNVAFTNKAYPGA